MLLAALALSAPAAQAQSTEWQGPSPGGWPWFHAPSWSAGVPDANTDAYIRNGGAVWIDGSVSPPPAQARNLFVEGGSTLEVINSSLTTLSGVIGDTAGSAGRILVGFGDANWNSGVIEVGRNGTGTLDVNNGGSVDSGALALGVEAGGSGTVTVDGAGSTLEAVDHIIVGGSGAGELHVNGQARVGTARLEIGQEAGSSGTVTVDGAGTHLESRDGAIFVGLYGDGHLTVSGGATVEGPLEFVSGSPVGIAGVHIGTYEGSRGTVVVTGAGSTLTTANDLALGGRGGEGRMEILDGGVVNNYHGFLGAYETGVDGGSGSVLVQGAGSTWNNAGYFAVGYQGDGMLEIADGGTVNNAFNAGVGQFAGTVGTVDVHGAGSRWNINYDLVLGDLGGASLSVRDGGGVSADGIAMGTSSSEGEIRMEVAGAGSQVDAGAYLAVQSIDGSTLEIRDGGVVNSNEGSVGDWGVNSGVFYDNSGTVLIEGEGSRWNVAGGFRAGWNDGAVTVRDGGVLATGDAQVGLLYAERFGGVPGTRAEVLVDGVGSAWESTGTITIGTDDHGLLDVRNGGVVSSAGGVVGLNADNTANRSPGLVRIDGAGSRWNLSGELVVGAQGRGRLEVGNQGVVEAGSTVVGSQAGGAGEVTVDGADSSLRTSDIIVVGQQGQGTVTLRNGGRLVSPDALQLAQGAGSTGILNIGTGGAAGVLEAPGVVGGAGTAIVNFNHDEDLVFDPDLSGSLQVRQIGSGTTTFLRDFGYLGGTYIGNGVLQLGNGGATGGIVGDVEIGVDGLLAINRSNAVDFLGSIGGAGAVHHIGSGTTTFHGTSSYTGATEVRSGTVLVEGELGDTTTTVYSGATLGGTGRIAGDVVVNDGGTLSPGTSPGTLTVGSLFLSEGAFLDYELGQAGVIGAGINDLVEIDGDLTLDGTLDITDAGGFGAGVYRLMNYGGDITDNGLDLGSLPAGFTSDDLFVQTAIAGQVNLINSAGVSLNFWDGAAGPTDDGIIQGGDGVWVSNDTSWTDADGALNGNWNEGFAVFGGAAGTVTVMGEQRFTGMQFMTDGYRLEPGTDAALRASGTTNLRVDPGVTATIAAPIVGDATLVKVDEGTLVLEGEFGYTGGVTVNGGRLVGDTGNLLGDILNRAELEFAQDEDDTYAEVISGEGELIKSGDGSLVLTGTNAYTGGTLIESGTLRIGAGGTSGSIVGDVEIDADGTLAFDRSDSISFAGAFSGEGALDKFGAGTLWLTGDSSDYAGQATLHAGGLRMDGRIGGFLDVLAGTTLTGSGTLGSVDNAGTISPDGTLDMTGDYLHRAGATYHVDIAPDGSSDLLDIVGTATIEGGTVYVIKAPGQYAGGSRYTIVDADGGVLGTFDALDQNLPFLDMFLTYDPNHVYLEIRRNDTEFGSLCGRGTFNQCEVAKTLDSFDPETPPSADIGEMVEQVTGMDEDTALAAFDRMSGEVHPSLAGIVLEGHALYGQAVTRRMAERREAIGADRLRGGAWVRAYGASSELDGDGNAHAADWDLRGLAVGYDAWGTEHWLIGAALNKMRLDADFRPGDRGEVDANNVSLYTSFQGERAYFDAVGSYAWWDNETTRAVEVGDIDRTATAQYRSHRFAGYLEAGWTFDLGERALLQPLLSLQYDNLASQAFREQGAQDLSLIARSDSVERLTLGAGARWSTAFDRGDWTIEPTAQVRWLHSEGDEYAEFDVAFSGAPNEGYRLPEFGWRVRGVTLPEDRGVVGMGLAARKDKIDLFIDYDFQAGDGFKAHNLGAGLRYRW